jgi:hypothetical protein
LKPKQSTVIVKNERTLKKAVLSCGETGCQAPMTSHCLLLLKEKVGVWNAYDGRNRTQKNEKKKKDS